MNRTQGWLTATTPAGTKVLIEGKTSWGIGTVEDIRPTEQPHEIEGAPPAEIRDPALSLAACAFPCSCCRRAFETLKETGIDLVALITCDGKTFAAIHAEGGEWYDLQQQRLTITPLATALAEALRGDN